MRPPAAIDVRLAVPVAVGWLALVLALPEPAAPGRTALVAGLVVAAGARVQRPLVVADEQDARVAVEGRLGAVAVVGVDVDDDDPLAGFGKAFDGPAIDPKVLAEQQKKLQEELEKRSDELRKRLESKKISKTEAVQAVAAQRMSDENIHVGPSDYVAWQNDNKVCFLRMEGELFGGVPMNLELRLSVEDSPNSAGVAIDMIRCAAVARDRGLAGPVLAPAAYFCKHPPRQMTDDEAYEAVEAFIAELPLAAPAS